MKTVRSIRGLALTGVAALGLIAMTPALADSQFNVGGSGTAANANLDFVVNIPTFVFLQIGDATTVDVVTFDVDAGDVVDQNYIGGGTAVAGDNTVPVTLIANVGTVTFGAASQGNLTAGPGINLPWDEITGTAAVGSGGNGLSVPEIDQPAVNVTANAGNIINRSDTWSFSFANTTPAAAGTYTGRVLYTATAP